MDLPWKSFFPLLLFFSLSLAPGAEKTRPIPGIDRIPRATDSAGALSKPPEEGVPGSSGSSPGFSGNAFAEGNPNIINLRVEKSGAYNARLTWNVNPTSTSGIYIGRYIKPVASRELLFEADNLTATPLGPSEGQYFDTNMPDGTYYYAVVTAEEIERSAGGKSQLLILKPNVNYTTSPLVIKRGTDLDAGATDRITALSAVNSFQSVKLNWLPPAGGGSYYIYRGRQAFNTPASFEDAVRIGTSEDKSPYFTDTAPVVNESVYYAVTRLKNGREERIAFLNQSFIQHTFRPVNLDAGMARKLPDALSAFVQSKNNAKLLWVDPVEDFQELRVYRSNRPIAGSIELGRARLAATVRKNTRTYLDRDLAPGRYFYAVLPVDVSGKQIEEFYEGRTFTGTAIDIRGATSGPRIEFLEAKATGSDAIRIRFEGYRENAGAVRYFIYRSSRLMQNVSDVRNHGRLIKEQELDDELLDRKLPAGRYYYAVLMEADGNLLEVMAPGKNYLEEPVVLAEKNEIPDIETVLNRTFRLRHYSVAVKDLQPFLAPEVPDEIRARAMLYIGLSYYQLGHYQSALRAFMDSNLRQHHPDRARFWYDRSIEKMRR